MKPLYDVIVPMTKDNLPVFRMNIQWMKRNLDCKRIIVIGAEGLREESRKLGAEFLNEDQLCEGMTLGAVKEYMTKRTGKASRSGWYFQQFLKFGYAQVCEDEYYIVWDSDTVPLHPISHFQDGKPVFTKKEEMEPPYFETLDRLFAGEVKRYGDFSFICENMIFSVAVMKEMLENLMQQPQLSGDSFWKRILSAVSDDNLPGSGFSEFETYGNYVMKYHPGMYALRTLRGLRKGAEFFGTIPTEKQLLWAAKSYDTIAFERWSHHRKILGRICRNTVIQKCFSLRTVVEMKGLISRIRSIGK
ncbi:hypothetical protein KFE18_09195 [Clostridiaceae bacterium Marseille-Q4143]|jgi:hypothetical protein|nr:hypothetical protein KFE18_09195 [Clostridiaceae bacterium Marseille-Q4143]